MFLAGLVRKRSRRITPSVEKWRLEHPHDTPPYPLTPSPTFVHSSLGARDSGSCSAIFKDFVASYRVSRARDGSRSTQLRSLCPKNVCSVQETQARPGMLARLARKT